MKFILLFLCVFLFGNLSYVHVDAPRAANLTPVEIPTVIETTAPILPTLRPAAYSMEAEACLRAFVPELDAYAAYIEEHSDGAAHLIIDMDGGPEWINSGDTSGSYYTIYVGEEWEDHLANWDWFYVHEDFQEVLWLDLVSDKLLTLDEWRDSPYYRGTL